MLLDEMIPSNIFFLFFLFTNLALKLERLVLYVSFIFECEIMSYLYLKAIGIVVFKN